MEAVPNTMRAAAIDRFGGPEVLTLQVLPVPAVGTGEVLIALHTSGVGPWDAAIREGWLPSRHAKFPMILGTDGAGTVAAIGPGVRRVAVGDRVLAYSFDNPKGGFYAEYAAVLEENVGLVPEGFDLGRAGAIPTTGLTALQGIDKALHLKKGQSVVIHGASGGVGTLAVQFAKLRGARVLATASGKDGEELVRRLGAEVTVDSRHGDVIAAAHRFAPKGLDAVLALANGKVLTHAIEMVRPGGKVAFPNGVEPEPKKRRGVEVIGYDAVANPQEFARLIRATLSANLEVPIAAAYALERAGKAHERLREGHVLGKIVFGIRAED